MPIIPSASSTVSPTRSRILASYHSTNNNKTSYPITTKDLTDNSLLKDGSTSVQTNNLSSTENEITSGQSTEKLLVESNIMQCRSLDIQNRTESSVNKQCDNSLKKRSSDTRLPPASSVVDHTLPLATTSHSPATPLAMPITDVPKQDKAMERAVYPHIWRPIPQMAALASPVLEKTQQVPTTTVYTGTPTDGDTAVPLLKTISNPLPAHRNPVPVSQTPLLGVSGLKIFSPD